MHHLYACCANVLHRELYGVPRRFFTHASNQNFAAGVAKLGSEAAFKRANAREDELLGYLVLDESEYCAFHPSNNCVSDDFQDPNRLPGTFSFRHVSLLS